ncbi:hypothetical protein [Methylobacterium sp. WL116]|uniref:hypothetical protein n=1 Tax=Methylobacterium sp. WL116 TaxID=2603889 RepID=UPI00164F6227|nr:hypothetical protein [Methylobacterium sp. WL116]
MQIDVKTITDGELSFLSGDGFKAALTLMAESWHETPAASLPDDDKRLAAYCGFGRSPAALTAWAVVRDEALSDFILCSDGRWYSRTMAPKALEAWKSRKAQSDRTAKARQVRQENRLSTKDSVPVVTTSVTEPVTTSATQSIGDNRRGEETRSEDRKVGHASGEPYAFEHSIIKLSQKDYDRFKGTYSLLNLDSELLSLAKWVEAKAKEKDGDWFSPMLGVLAKKQRDAEKQARETKANADAMARRAVRHVPGNMAI